LLFGLACNKQSSKRRNKPSSKRQKNIRQGAAAEEPKNGRGRDDRSRRSKGAEDVKMTLEDNMTDTFRLSAILLRGAGLSCGSGPAPAALEIPEINLLNSY
jgi:hypothetical protein